MISKLYTLCFLLSFLIVLYPATSHIEAAAGLLFWFLGLIWSFDEENGK